MARRLYRPRELDHQIFRGSDAINQGILTPQQLRSAAWIRLRYDVFADARVDRTHELRCRAAMFRLPSDAVLAGRTAAYLYGIRHAATFHDPVHLIVPPGSRLGPRAGLKVHEVLLTPVELSGTLEFPCTSPLRAAWDLAMWEETVAAVTVIDGLQAAGLVSATDLDLLVARRRGLRGWQRAKEVFALSDGRAQSPPESSTRVRLILAGLPAPVPQVEVRVSAGLVLHPDLGWEEFMVGLEYDGDCHNSPEQQIRDQNRLRLLEAAGWIIIRVDAHRMRTDFAGVVREVHSALRSRGWRP